MQRRIQNHPLRERLPSRLGGRPSAPVRRRRISRREREARRRRQLYWGMSIVAGLVVLILAVGLINEYIIKPRHVLASVNGTEIRRRDYWKARSLDLINQATEYGQLATSDFMPADQQQQYVQLAAQTLDQADDVWGTTDVDDALLNRMITDQIYVQNLDDLGLSISDQEIDDYIAQRFRDPGAVIFTPTPSATLIPERAAMLTATAAAARATPVAGTPPDVSGSPMAAASPVAPTTAALPRPPGAIVASPTDASPAASPAGASPEVGTPAPTATPNPEQARATAVASFEQLRESVFEDARLSRADYEKWVARPAVAREKIEASLTSQIGQAAEQVHAAHILVDTQDLANQIAQQLQQPGANFEEIARQQSTDEATKGNGGDLGWFTRGTMVDAFADVAFNLAPGTVSEPFKSEFGWHIVKVYAHEQNRPLTEEQLDQLRQETVDDWVQTTRDNMDIESDLDPTPTPEAATFEPPPDAPPPPTPTPTPVALPAASPGATVPTAPAPAG